MVSCFSQALSLPGKRSRRLPSEENPLPAYTYDPGMHNIRLQCEIMRAAVDIDFIQVALIVLGEG